MNKLQNPSTRGVFCYKKILQQLLTFASMLIQNLYELYKSNPSVQTDTRKIKPGDIFVALKGPNYNGNHYTKQALDIGASYCIVDEEIVNKDNRIIKVDDSLQSLQALAHHHRCQFNIPFIAITGSNGKTTTKELVHAVLSTRYKTYTTEGNLNNHIGIPLTILKIRHDAEMAIIEMGANHQKEIAGYCKYAMPTHGMITNCGKAHLEGFGGVEGVKKGKGELYDHLRNNNGSAFVCWDYDYLREMSAGIPTVVRYGTNENEGKVDYLGKSTGDSEFLNISIIKGAELPVIKTNLIGSYNLPNALAAITIGKFFSVSDDNIKNALENYQATNSRSQLVKKGSNKIILDAYNANPSSMKVAVENFAAMDGQKKIIILGAMMEMGDQEIVEHQRLVELVGQFPWHAAVFVGKEFKNVPAGMIHFNKTEEAVNWFREQQIEHATILLKGSRSMQMEKLIE